jgi:hypothetical protein
VFELDVKGEDLCMLKHSIVAGLFVAAILVVVPSRVMAQEDHDNFFVSHFGPPDQTYTFVNPCAFTPRSQENPTAGTPTCSEFDAASYVCANIYVYSNQDIIACGSCPVSPNGSIEVDKNADLIGAPTTPAINGRGVVKIVPTQFPTSTFFCDPTNLGRNGNFLSVFVAQGTNEFQLDGAILGGPEKAKLEHDCDAVVTVLSGRTNVTCGTMDPPKIPVRKFYKPKNNQ